MIGLAADKSFSPWVAAWNAAYPIVILITWGSHRDWSATSP